MRLLVFEKKDALSLRDFPCIYAEEEVLGPHESRLENTFRYAHVSPRCVATPYTVIIDVKPLITKTFEFDECVRTFKLVSLAPPDHVTMQIVMPQSGKLTCPM